MVKLAKSREVTIPHDDFSITWKFPLTTDIEMSKARQILRDSVKGSKISADDDYVFDVYLMNSIHKIEGFQVEEGVDITELTLDVKRAVYDHVKGEKEYWLKVVTAYDNVKGKNFVSGQTHSSTGTGDQTSAPSVKDAMETEPVSDVVTPQV